MDESLQTRAWHLSRPCEGFIGGPADGDMVPVPCDPVRPKSDNYLRAFLKKDSHNPPYQLVKIDFGQMPVCVVQPFVTVRDCAVGPPSIDAFPPPPCTQFLWCSRDALGNLPGPTVSGKNQAKPETRVVLVQGN